MHTRSSGVYPRISPMKKPLLRMLWCERVAPFGKPVVPDEQGVPFLAENDRALERRRVDGREQLAVVRVLEARGEDQERAARLAQRVLELVRPVRGVDVDEDRADLRRRE